MRSVEVLSVVSAALFVTGVGLVIVGSRAVARGTPPSVSATPPAATPPLASVRQLMIGVVEPAANAVFNSVSTTVTDKGTEEKAPSTPEEWEAIGASAAALGEAGQWLLMDGRAVDRQDWPRMAQAMVEAARLTIKAAESRSPQAVFDAGGELYVACDNCHRQYMR